MKSTWGQYWATTAIAIIAISPVLLSAPVNAQISAAQDGTNTVVLPNGQRFDITGGTQAGANLFHSFQQFGLSQGQVANFLSQPNIQNILGRVVGGDPSVINGLIQLTGGNSNLYIMNPAGVIFGSNASLNIPASFTATTANGIQVGNSWFGMNTIASDLKNLTGTPNAFAFTNPTTALTQGQTSGVIVNQGNLSVSQGKSITLVGGIVINTGTIESPNGNINIVAVPDGKYVRITPEGGVLSFDLAIATQQELGNTTLITGIDLPKLLTGSGIVATSQKGTAIISGNLNVSGNNSGNIQVLGNSVSLASAKLDASGLNGGGTVLIGGDYQGTGTTPKAQTTTVDLNSTINADALTNGNGGKVVVWSDVTTIFDGKITAKGGTQGGNGGLIETSGKNNLVVGNNAQVNTLAPQGEIGTWLLDPTSITVVASGGTDPTVVAANANAGASTINNSVIVAALNGANVTLTATNSIAVNALINSSANAGAGNLTLNAPTTNLNAGITLRAGSTLLGNATTVNVGTGGTVQNGVDVAAAGGTVNLAVATYTLAGTVAINKNLTLNGASAASTTVSGNNAFRVFEITGTSVALRNLSIINGLAAGGGGIRYTGIGTLDISNTNISNNQSNTGNDGGGIRVNSGTLNLTNSTVSANTITNVSGNGGGIGIRPGAVANISNTTISGNRTIGVGGGINVNNGTLNIFNSTIYNNTAGDLVLANDAVVPYGGGIANSNGNVTVKNTIVAGNNIILGITPNTGIDVSGTFTDLSGNLVGKNNGSTGFTNGVQGSIVGTIANPINPQLAPLANYGGVTQTHALIANSPALDAGNNANAPVGNDQRGATRIFGSAVDIGAFESQGFSLTPLANTTPQSTNINTSFTQPLGVQVTENFVNAPIPAPNILVTFAPPSSSANGLFAGNTNVLTNNLGIALAPTFTANGIPGSYSVSATANGFKPITFSLTNKVAGGFGGVFPSREDLEGRAPRLDEQDLEVSFTQVLCLDPSLATTQTTSIPTCKK
jgi:filamentous hemagglutinin family protein